jgi:hypothetical protein
MNIKIRESKKKSGKGQAALEFMMTYGWAFLLLGVMIAGLAYVMPHPKALAANKCLFGSSIPCLGAQLTSDNLTIALRNGAGHGIYNLTARGTMPENVSCAVNNKTIRAEERITVVCNNTKPGGFNVTDDSRINIELTYRNTRDGYDQIVLGEIYAKYQKLV